MGTNSSNGRGSKHRRSSLDLSMSSHGSTTSKVSASSNNGRGSSHRRSNLDISMSSRGSIGSSKGSTSNINKGSKGEKSIRRSSIGGFSSLSGMIHESSLEQHSIG